MKVLYQAENISLSSTLKDGKVLPAKFRQIPFGKIKDDILGKKYELSLVFVGPKFIKSLNFKYRKINKPTDVLSFEISPLAGEIFICPAAAKKKAPKFDKTYEEYLLFLVIHGSLHLKGLSHGDKMDAYELTYHSRYRRRYLRSARGSR